MSVANVLMTALMKLLALTISPLVRAIKLRAKGGGKHMVDRCQFQLANVGDAKMSGSLRRNEEPREPLHDYSIDYVKAIAEVFGWRVRAFKGPQKGGLT
jgi:hypothetical protein